MVNEMKKDLEKWYSLQAELKELKAKEFVLRKKMFNLYFKEPVEGTNSHELPDGFVLKGKQTITRNVDEAILNNLQANFRQEKIDVDSLITRKPSLNVKTYRTLNSVQKNSFDRCLLIKTGAPALEIVEKKK